MKKIKTIGMIFIILLVFFGCEKIDNPVGMRGVAVIPAISDINPAIFNSKDLENSFIEFVVDLVPGTHLDKLVIEGSYNGNLERIEITEVTTFPATVRILSSVAAEKLGIALDEIENGGVFTFELVATNGGITTRSNAALNIPVACAYDVNLATGSYHSVSADWGSDGDITITSDPNDPYIIYVSGLEEIEGLVEDQGPLEMHINPVNYTVTAEKKVLASDAFGYHNIAYEGSGEYSSCDGSYSMYFEISVDEGNFGTYQFSFTRNQ